jgi:hypothetical protein
MSKLKKKILLALLMRHDQSSERFGKSCSVVELSQMIYPKLREHPYSAWGEPVSVRRALESLRKQGLILKSPSQDSEADYGWYDRGRHWKAILTEKGVNVARPMREGILAYISEWFEYVTAIEKSEQSKELEAKKE